LPYFGDESITFPPRRLNSARTSSSGFLSFGEVPTSKVAQVPNPSTGIASPVFGIGLVKIGCSLSGDPLSGDSELWLVLPRLAAIRAQAETEATEVAPMHNCINASRRFIFMWPPSSFW